MLLTAGGGLIWWVWDLFHIRTMVKAFNAEEDRRAETQLAPQGLGFLPPKQDLQLSGPPVWASKRQGRLKVFGAGILLSVIGFVIGAISGATEIYEPVLIILIFIVITLTAARWRGLLRIPVLGSLGRWSHRLRLYYYTVDPGSAWLLALRPVIGVLFAPWQQKARAEVRLYLQLGVAVTLAFTFFDLLEISESESLSAGIGLMAAEFFQTLIYTYAFVPPVGAILTTQLLLSRHDRVVWTLSALTLTFVYLGLLLVGAL